MKTKNLRKSKKVTNKGITLIALVITIIVLLILAGVSIAMLTGDNGILTQAQTSKERTEIAEVKEQARLDIMAWRAERLANGEDAILDNETVKTIITGKEYVETLGETSFTTENGYEITYSELYEIEGNEATVGQKVTGSNKTYTKNGTAIIPVGFTIVPGLDDVSEGLVISDDPNDTEEGTDTSKHQANGNQFVWVPVSQSNFEEEFVREHFGTEDQKWWGDFVIDKLSTNNMYEPKADGKTVNEDATESEQEVQKMYKSVRDNGGFYIARYEAGKDELNNVLCKKDVNVYNNIVYRNTGGAVEKARGFATSKGYTNVTSTLCYGVQWDAIMRWLNADSTLQQYLSDSSTVGNYSDSDDTNNPATTGAKEEYKLKNIYDLAGNVLEWSMETYDADGKGVFRGGYYSDNGSEYPVSTRGADWSQSFSDSGVGFRVALYL